MSGNPLQQHFRQPKIYIKLPTGGIYNKLGSLQGDVTNMAIYGMTGMDEIVLKTPDALLSGESTRKVVESCCPTVKDAWALSTLDMPIILAALRIATYGSKLPILHTCPNCKTENEYDVDLGRLIEFYNQCKFNNSIVVGGLTVKLQPMTYKQSTDFNVRNFQLQQRLSQADTIEDSEAKQQFINELFVELGDIQTEIYMATVEAVELTDAVVTDHQHITEWLHNCDSEVFDQIKAASMSNRDAWTMPPIAVTCDTCEHAANVSIELDQSNFFVKA